MSQIRNIPGYVIWSKNLTSLKICQEKYLNMCTRVRAIKAFNWKTHFYFFKVTFFKKKKICFVTEETAQCFRAPAALPEESRFNPQHLHGSSHCL